MGCNADPDPASACNNSDCLAYTAMFQTRPVPEINACWLLRFTSPGVCSQDQPGTTSPRQKVAGKSAHCSNSLCMGWSMFIWCLSGCQHLASSPKHHGMILVGPLMASLLQGQIRLMAPLCLQDHYDVKMPCHSLLAKMSQVAPGPVLAELDRLVEPLAKTLTAPVKSSAVKQEVSYVVRRAVSRFLCTPFNKPVWEVCQTTKSGLLCDKTSHCLQG